MQLRFTEFDEFLAFNKAFGVRTHRVADGQFGFIEYVNEKLDLDLKVVHRLDKETSGLILFAKTKEAAKDLSQLFETHKIKKTYVFLTDNESPQKKMKIRSHIEKQSEFFVNVDGLEANAETDFEYVEKTEAGHLWHAFPKTGKPHQIRLHAQLAGIPVLGDSEHGGSPHHRLALHALRIEFSLNGKNFDLRMPAPNFINLLEDALFSRQQLFEIESGESYRLCHREYDKLRADVFADRLWVYDYFENGAEKSLLESIRDFAQAHDLVPFVRRMLDRGSGVGGMEKATLESVNTENWVAKEEGVSYHMRSDSGFSPGLFLDQRENRSWVRRRALGKKVLNLFAYTGGFSVCAALGKAEQVTTVDVSKKFLEWSQENFKLNRLETSSFEFFCQDTLLFLKGSVKRKRAWDLIICDPPSFGRSKDAVWKLEQNLSDLAELLWQCLTPGGEILFTCNLERKTRTEILALFSKKLPKNKFELSRMPMLSLDFESTDDFSNLMKGFILKRLN